MSRSVLDYFLNKDGLPDPNGALSSQLPSQAIALANQEAASVLQRNGNSVKRQRGSYLQPVSELTALKIISIQSADSIVCM